MLKPHLFTINNYVYKGCGSIVINAQGPSDFKDIILPNKQYAVLNEGLHVDNRKENVCVARVLTPAMSLRLCLYSRNILCSVKRNKQTSDTMSGC